jgi:hypothetical protein
MESPRTTFDALMEVLAGMVGSLLPLDDGARQESAAVFASVPVMPGADKGEVISTHRVRQVT